MFYDCEYEFTGIGQILRKYIRVRYSRKIRLVDPIAEAWRMRSVFCLRVRLLGRIGAG